MTTATRDRDLLVLWMDTMLHFSVLDHFLAYRVREAILPEAGANARVTNDFATIQNLFLLIN